MLKERAERARDACPRCGAQRTILMRPVDDVSPSEPRFVCPRCGYPDPLHEPT
jgi:ribosomal protein S27AE